MALGKVLNILLPVFCCSLKLFNYQSFRFGNSFLLLTDISIFHKGLQGTPTKDMTAAKEYTDEQLNYFKICHVTTDILTEGLRIIFKQEWDSLYRTTLGEWKDDPSNGKDFYSKESPRNQRRHQDKLSTMIKGNRAEWDCTMLFYAILYSDCIYSLNAAVRTNVDDLRKFRNEEFARMPQGQLSELDFKIAIGKVFAAFQALGLSTTEIQQISNQKTFPREEVRDLLAKVKVLKKDLDIKEKDNKDLEDKLKKTKSQLQDLENQLKETRKQRISLEDRLKETEKQQQVLKSEINETEEKRMGLEDLLEKKQNELKETEEKRRNLTDQLKTTEERQKNLKDNLKETEERRKSLEDQLQEKEKQLKVLSEQLLNDTSPFCILPPKPSHDIASRDVEVADITNQLQELKRADASNLSILYISGNPGSGKSQLAGLVAERFYEKAKEDSCSEVFVMTLNAETLGTLLDSYITFARRMKCPEDAITHIHISKDLKTEDKINSLISLISSKIGQYESWLLLADNVKSLSEMHVHLPQQGHGQWGRGYLLITTQDSTCIPLTSTSIRHISVSEGMQSQEACSLLALISGISDSEIGEIVARELDYQPLALASAATYVKQLRQSKRFSEFGWNDFLRKVQKGQRDATETLLTETNPCYKKSMTTATTLAVKEVMQSDRIIDHALSFLCLLSSQPLNVDIVVNYIVSVDEGIKDKEMITMKLQRCSLILSHKDEFGSHIQVHQVVCDVVKSLNKGYPESRHMKTLNSAVAAFNQFIDDNLPEESSDSILQSYALAFHLKYFILSFEKVLFKVALPEIIQPEMGQLGKICENHCHFQAAKKFYEFSLQAYLKKFGPKHTSVATSYNNLGSVHVQLSDFKKAEEYYELALTIYQKKLGPENVSVATSYNNLGLVHDKVGDFEKAKEYHELALTIYQKKLGPENVEVATSYNSLGLVHDKLGDFEKAKEYHKLALTIYQKKLGPENVSVATSYNDLGLVHDNLGDFEKAKNYYELALTIYQKKLGPENVVEVATSYNNLGLVHDKLGDFEKAKEYHELALTIYQKMLGPENVEVATSYNNLGLVHEKLGDFEKAKEYHKLALTIYQKKLGPENVSVAISYSNLGAVHDKLGDFEKAKEYHELALTIKQKKLGPDNVSVATSYNNLGVVHHKLGDFEKAKEYHELALSIRQKKLGAENVQVATSYNNLGSVHEQLGDFEKAKEYHELALSIYQKKLGPENVDVATSYNNLGLVHDKLGDFEKAKEYHELSLTIKQKKLGTENVSVGTSYSNLGLVHDKVGDFEKAKEYHELALTIKQKKLGPDNVSVATSYNNLGVVHHKLGDFEKAKEYHELALSIKQKKLGPENVSVATSYSNLGLVHDELGDFEKAKEYHELALSIR